MTGIVYLKVTSGMDQFVPADPKAPPLRGIPERWTIFLCVLCVIFCIVFIMSALVVYCFLISGHCLICCQRGHFFACIVFPRNFVKIIFACFREHFVKHVKRVLLSSAIADCFVRLDDE